MDISELNDEQNEKIDRFLDCVSSQEKHSAISLLKENNWDIDKAILKYYKDQQNKKTPTKNLQAIITYPFTIIKSIGKYIYSLFYVDLKKEIIENHSKLQKLLNENGPNFMVEIFDAAVEKSRREDKLLFVYLHNGYAKGAQYENVKKFCKMLTSPVISDFLNQNFINWTTEISSESAKPLLRQGINPRSPYFLVATSNRQGNFHPIIDHQGPVESDNFIVSLMDCCQTFDLLKKQQSRNSNRNFNAAPPNLAQNLVQNLAQNSARNSAENLIRNSGQNIQNEISAENFSEKSKLQKQQNNEYEKAISADIEKIRVLEEEKILEEQRKRDELIEQNKAKEKVEKMRIEFENEPGQEEENTVLILIQMPNGDAFKRRFFEFDKISKLYLFVELNQRENSPKYISPPFKIVSVFPSQEFPNSEKTLKEMGLTGRAKVYVKNDIDD